jgi:transposase
VAYFYGVNLRNLQRHYKDYLSDFKQWNQKSHAKYWLLFPENLDERLSLDEPAVLWDRKYWVQIYSLFLKNYI